MINVKSSITAVMITFLFSFTVQANLILIATYSDWTKTGPLSFGLATMPDEFSATFIIKPPPPPPVGPIPIPYPNTAAWTHADVVSATVSFGDATWTTLAWFDFEIDDGELFLDYAFQPLVSTLTAEGPVILNGPLSITGIDIGSKGDSGGGNFIYGYGNRTLSLHQVPEPTTFLLMGIGVVFISWTKSKRNQAISVSC